MYAHVWLRRCVHRCCSFPSLRFFDADPLKSIQFATSLLFYVSFRFWPQGMCDPSFPTRDGTRDPCVGRWCLDHWTAREVLLPSPSLVPTKSPATVDKKHHSWRCPGHKTVQQDEWMNQCFLQETGWVSPMYCSLREARCRSLRSCLDKLKYRYNTCAHQDVGGLLLCAWDAFISRMFTFSLDEMLTCSIIKRVISLILMSYGRTMLILNW